MVVTPCLDVSVPATLAHVRGLRTRVTELAKELGADDDLAGDIRLCVSEALTNVVTHAYGTEVGDMTVTVETARDELTVVVADHGKGLSEFRREGELGYGLKIIDRLAHRYVIASSPSSGTEVRMIFALARPHEQRTAA